MRKYYTTFVFKGEDPIEGLHCTHSYFGKIVDNAAGSVMAELCQHFSQFPFKPFEATFDRAALFGPKKDIPVLLAAEGQLEALRYPLWVSLGEYALRSYGSDYRPHVTIAGRQHILTAPLKLEVVNYALVQDKRVVWQVAK